MKLSLIVPVFNEEDAIPIFYQTVRQFKSFSQYVVEIIFINDGSRDKTSDIAGALSHWPILLLL